MRCREARRQGPPSRSFAWPYGAAATGSVCLGERRPPATRRTRRRRTTPGRAEPAGPSGCERGEERLEHARPRRRAAPGGGHDPGAGAPGHSRQPPRAAGACRRPAARTRPRRGRTRGPRRSAPCGPSVRSARGPRRCRAGRRHRRPRSAVTARSSGGSAERAGRRVRGDQVERLAHRHVDRDTDVLGHDPEGEQDRRRCRSA